MDELVNEGITDFKLFTAYPGVFYSDDGAIFRAMQQTEKNGGLIMMHAENGMAIDVVAAQLVDAGQDRSRTTTASRATRSSRARRRTASSAWQRRRTCRSTSCISPRATRCRWFARRATEGSAAFAETCPQYLFLSLDDMGNGFEGAKFICSPPLAPADHQEQLWQGLVKDDLQVVSTDHCPFDFHGQKELGRGDFRKVPNGLPGVEDRVDLMHDGGCRGRHDAERRWVEVISAAPARMFGLAGSKASSPPAPTPTLSSTTRHDATRSRASSHHMDVDYSCYEGREVTGGADTVLSRGKVIVDGAAWKGAAGDGRFLKRQRSMALR